jgi:uncharacterized protein (DUF697 family)
MSSRRRDTPSKSTPAPEVIEAEAAKAAKAAKAAEVPAKAKPKRVSRPAKRAAAGRPSTTHATEITSALERELTMSEHNAEFAPHAEHSNGTVPAEPPPAAQAIPPASANDVRKLRCDVTITKHIGAAMGFGFLPLPMIDFVAITGVQMDLVYRLSRIYDVEFSTQAVRALLGSLLGASVPLQPALISGLKLMPGIGTAAAFVAQPALAGASTYAIGKVFVEHFESGGTLLTFNASKMKAHFEQRMNEGKQVVANMRKS